MQLDLFSPASTDADKPIACAVEIPGVRNLAPLLLMTDGTWRVTDGREPTDLDWRETSRTIVSGANRRRILDREHPVSPGMDGWLTTSRCIGYDPAPAVRGAVWLWLRVRWDDPRLVGSIP